MGITPPDLSKPRKPSLRPYAYAIIALIRMHRLKEHWARSTRVRDTILAKIEEMRIARAEAKAKGRAEKLERSIERDATGSAARGTPRASGIVAGSGVNSTPTPIRRTPAHASSARRAVSDGALVRDSVNARTTATESPVKKGVAFQGIKSLESSLAEVEETADMDQDMGEIFEKKVEASLRKGVEGVLKRAATSSTSRSVRKGGRMADTTPATTRRANTLGGSGTK